jgi:aspartyl protease family protein
MSALVNHRQRFAWMLLGLLASRGAAALDVNVVGLFPNKAVVQIDGGRLQTLSVDGDRATFDVEGQRVTLAMGHARMKASSGPESVLLTANERGHFVTEGQINGIPIQFAVDTGATFISLPAREARRLELDYRKGQRAIMETANGNAPAYRIRLDTVRVGDITVHSVDAVVMEGDNPSVALLGMSFLNRMDIKREGEIMTLTKRY